MLPHLNLLWRQPQRSSAAHNWAALPFYPMESGWDISVSEKTYLNVAV